ncbi:hypothetical protein FACS189490_07050 [Clostridia bacterium]|nr:hypothetical protein FACS189490_07050 [Clostridia bacterium]
MSENVKIPLTLFNDTINLLENIYNSDCAFSDFPDDFYSYFESVLLAFKHKKQLMELRDTYAKVVNAKDEDARHATRMLYLEERHMLKDDF